MRFFLAIALILTLIVAPCSAQEFTLRENGHAKPEGNYSPYIDQHFPQNVYFGDTHLHTSWSADA